MAFSIARSQMLSVLVLLSVVGYSQSSSWNYDDTSSYGPSNWATDYSDYCSGTSQSPVDIDTDDVEVDTTLDDLTFTVSTTVNWNDIKAANNGHSVAYQMDDGSDYPITASGGGLPYTYTLAGFHMHWGSSSSTGSEHTVNGKQYDAEMHSVFYNSDDYADIDLAIASEESDALAVFGILFNEGSANSYLDEAISATSEVTNDGDEYTLTASGEFDFASLIASVSPSNFYRYDGGFTTPSCNEVVTWTVFHKKTTMSSAQLDNLYDLMYSNSSETDDPMINNFRPVQDLNGRIIYSSSSHMTAAPSIITVTLCVLMMSSLKKLL